MISISKLKEEELLAYKDKKIILFHQAGGSGRELYRIFKRLNITVIGCYCIDKTKLKGAVKSLTMGLKPISRKAIEKMLRRGEKIMGQPMGFDLSKLSEMENTIKMLDLECSNISSGKLMLSFDYLNVLNEFEKSFLVKMKRRFWEIKARNRYGRKWSKFSKKLDGKTLILCLPPKTADYSLMATLNKVNLEQILNNGRRVRYFNLWHTSKCLNKRKLLEKQSKVKIITAVREPISQMLSQFFQELSVGNFNRRLLYNSDMRELSDIKKLLHGETYDIQRLFDRYINMYYYFSPKKNTDTTYPRVVSRFMDEFKGRGFDLVTHDFDQEKGYTIIKEGNVEIFVYQLEKLNDIVLELSEWIGVPFDKLEKGNAAEDKWIADSYKQALKEIQITQEYFDRCFDEPYVKHCYSEADIEKFKARWRPHIKGSIN